MMKHLSAAIAVAAVLVTGTAFAQSKPRPLLDRELVQKASPAQQEAFGSCVEASVKECTLPTCEQGSKAQVEQCHAEWGNCRAAKVKACSDRILRTGNR